MSRFPGLEEPSKFPGLEGPVTLPKTQTSVGFFGQPVGVPGGNTPIDNVVTQKVAAESSKVKQGYKFPGVEDAATVYPGSLDQAMGKSLQFPGIEPDKGIPAYPYNREVIQTHYPELVSHPEKRDLFSEFAAAVLHGFPHEGGYIPGSESLEPTRDDVAGTVANVAGGFVVPVVAGRAAPGLFGAQSYFNTLDRTKSPVAAIGAGLAAYGLGLVPAEELTQTPQIQKLITRLGGESKARKYLVDKAAEAIAVSGTGAAFPWSDELIARTAGADPHEVPWVESMVSMLGLHYGVRGLGLVKTKAQSLMAEEMRKKFVSDKLVTADESALIGPDQPRVYADIAARRSRGDQVEVTRDGGKIQVKTTGTDLVDWVTKEKLGHDEGLIQLERERRARGEPSIFVDPSRLPVTKEESGRLVDELTKLRDSIQSEVKPEERTEFGKPVTQRALVLEDLNRQIQILGANPESRLEYQRAEALRNVANRDKSSLEVIPEFLSSQAGTADTLLSVTKDDMRPVERLVLPLVESEAKGYLKDPTQLAQDPKVQSRLATIRKQTLAKLTAIQDTIRADPERRLVMARALDVEHIARVEKTLEKDSAPKTSQARVTRALGRIKGPKLEALTALDRAYAAIAKGTSEESLKGLLDRLKDHLEGAPQYVRDLLDGLGFQHVIAREQYLYGDNWPKTEQAVKHSLIERATTTQRDRILDGLKVLDDTQREAFVKALGKARDVKTIDELADKIHSARQVVERQQNMAFLKRNVNKQDKNPQREGLFALLTKLRPEPKAQPKEVTQGVTLSYEDRVYRGGKTSGGLEEQHRDVYDRVLKELPQDKRADFTKKFLADELSGFYTNKREHISRDEAALVSQGKSEKSTVEPSKATEVKPLVVTDPATGKRSIDWRQVEAELAKLSHDELQDLTNRYRQLMRQGLIERGLYTKTFGYSKEQNAEGVSRQLASSKKRASSGDRDWYGHVAGLATDPVSYEGLAAQRSGFDVKKPLYRIFFGKMVGNMNRHLQNQADARRFLDEELKGLGLRGETGEQQLQASKYMMEPLGDGFTRGEAMHAYALAGDEGRSSDLFAHGYRKNGKIVDPTDMISKLSSADKAFVDRLKNYFQQNPVIEKAFSEFLLHNGYEPQRSRGWWASSRKPEEESPKQDFGTFTNTIQRITDNLRDRQENVNTPFEARDFVGHFLKVHDKLSLYAELGRNLREAQETLYAPKVEEGWKKHFGASDYDSMKLYLANLYGHVGHSRTAFDMTIQHLTSAYTASKIALNLGSAAKQFLHLNTMLADGTLSPRALFKAMSEGAFFSRDVGQRMTDNNGLAYLRYHGNFFGDLTNLAEFGEQPSRLKLWRDRSLVLQREADRAVMKIAWRAAEITAAREGLTGNVARERASELFNISAGRDQPTSNPLYATELEIQAKRQPLMRGALMFMREQNRIYNVVRRRVVEATQNPTPENRQRATRALLFGVIANAMGVVAINSARRAVFDKDTTDKDLTKDTLESVTGMYYLGAPVDAIAAQFYDPNAKGEAESKSPATNIVTDLVQLTAHMRNAYNAGDETLRSGPHRGESKRDNELVRALDRALSATGAVSGLPFWGVWTQARGLFNWKHPEYRLMTQFEQARQAAKANPDSSEFKLLQATAERLSKIQTLRRSGLLTESEARQEVVNELRQVVR